MKIIKRKPSKICPCCGKRFFRKKPMSITLWKRQIYCCLKCGKQKVPLEEYFNSKFQLILLRTSINEKGCHEYNGLLQDGYGRFKVLGKPELVHRFIWKSLKGDIPEGLCVLHKCDNRKCVNPDHLFLGTNYDNIQDKMSKGRQFKKLSSDKLNEILFMLKEGIKYNEIAELFNVHKSNISFIAISNGLRRSRIR